nr:MAG TPA: hypothetical protein [Caudoviricetes sp.]
MLIKFVLNQYVMYLIQVSPRHQTAKYTSL